MSASILSTVMLAMLASGQVSEDTSTPPPRRDGARAPEANSKAKKPTPTKSDPEGKPHLIDRAIERVNSQIKSQPGQNWDPARSSGPLTGRYMLRPDNARYEVQTDGSVLLTGTLTISLGSEEKYRTKADRDDVETAKGALDQAKSDASMAIDNFKSQWFWRDTRAGGLWFNVARPNCPKRAITNAVYQSRLSNLTKAQQLKVKTATQELENLKRQITQRIRKEKAEFDRVRVEMVVPEALAAQIDWSLLNKRFKPTFIAEVTTYETDSLPAEVGGDTHIKSVVLQAVDAGKNLKAAQVAGR